MNVVHVQDFLFCAMQGCVWALGPLFHPKVHYSFVNVNIWHCNRCHWWVLSFGRNHNHQMFVTFVKAIHDNFECKYLWQSSHDDLKKQLRINENCNFPKMFTSLDCVYYGWKIAMLFCKGNSHTRINTNILF